ncbi:MAG: hypothetical protein PHP69_03340 [Candidatus Omnitrophica bacterium]|nr:hypothetical protein [Candidatus Omnitrophota bacterium]MDD5081723.1 hypothetical protein [Candidatus Omnitrophota bacterium]MDD5441702.1 hypothetical protein [Candidatus Omnitrophota bacterium]
MPKQRNTNKRYWQKPEMIQIKLNPEQAVLSCCDNIERGFFTTSSLQQCGTKAVNLLLKLCRFTSPIAESVTS